MGWRSQELHFCTRTTGRDSFVDSVRSIVAESSVAGYPDLATVAGKAGVTVRTLQRRLARAGLTFSSLAIEARLDRARELLGDRSLQIEAIASMLGYSDAANFTRAFKNRAGMTPTRYRKSVTGRS